MLLFPLFLPQQVYSAGGSMNNLQKINTFLNGALMGIAGFCLIGMMILACTNVFLRSVWEPVKGTFELMGFFGAIVAAFALGQTQIRREHIAVDFLVKRFPHRIKRYFLGLNYLIGLAFFALLCRQTAVWGTNLWQVNELSETLRIIYYPFVYAVSVGCAVLSLVMLIDFLKLIKPEER